ncbi:MAG: RidA family protein [Planctomycetota bacterium]|jgi:enamine deaminase RidA (YjgF/YER057c/UK114 family)|nr:RidA family protein [Planctomycetota bacterium]MDA1211410.1 RidA family protein [Planctomycetota bacterium]
MSIEKRISELNLELPTAPKPGGTYSPVVIVGNICYVSGHGPLKPDGTMITGRVGDQLTEEEGNAAARQTGLAILATLQAQLGSLDRIERFVKTLGMVYAVPEFKRHPQVINGFSDLIVEIWGEKGKAARSAVGMGSLPNNIPVEVECIVLLKDEGEHEIA